MADDLKRVGLKFTADGARDFKNELKECSAATKENYSELKLAQSQYDKNTTSAKKLEDRQKYLANQTDIYKDKVSILNSQLKEMESAENRDETAIAKKKAELNQAQAKLNEYEKSLEDVNKQLETHSQKLTQWGGGLKEMGGKIQDVGSKVSAVGDTMTKKVTVPIAAAGAASVAAWKEVDEGLDIVIKKTGATGKAAENLKNNVKNLATSIPTDFATAGNAVGEVNTRFGLTGKELENLSGKFIKFADLNDTDVSSSIDNTQKVLEAFNLDGKDAGAVLDVLNKTGQDTGIGMDELTNSLLKNAPAMQEMGFSVSDSAKFLGDLEVSGADSTTVLAGLKKAITNAAKEGKPMSDALSEAENSIKNAGSSTEATQKAIELFGTKAGPAIAKAVRDGQLSFEDLETSLSDYAGSVENTFEDTKDPLNGVKTLMNELKLIGADIVDTSAPMIKQALTAIRDVVKDLSKKWNGLSEDQQRFIIKAALVVAALGPVIAIIGKIIFGVGTVITIVGNLMTGIGGIVGAITAAGGLIPAIAAAATAAAPFLIGGAIIVAIIAAIVLLIKNWDKVKEAVGKVVEGIKKTWTDLKQSTEKLVNDAKQSWESLKNGVKEKAEALRSAASEKFSSLKTNASNTFNSLKESARKKMESAKEIVKDKMDAIKEKANFVWNLPKVGMDFVNSVPGKIKGIVDRIKKIFDFKISFPHIKLPHFSWTWQDIGGVVSVPNISVDWYRKAYDRAAYYTRPTVRADGRGFGDRQGGEFAVGESKLSQVVGDAVRRNSENSGNSFVVNITINAKEGQDTRELAREVADEIKNIYDREGVVWA